MILHFRNIVLLVCMLACQEYATAQTIDSIKGYVNARAYGAYRKQLPYWFRSNVYGNKPSVDGVADVTVAAYKPYNAKKQLDWSAGLEVQGSVKKVTIIEGYVKGRWRFLELSAGRMKDMVGLADSSLSSGSFSVSGNALGVPQVKLGMVDYVSLPLFRKVFAVKVSMSHGWMGMQPIQDVVNSYVKEANTYLHAGSFYVRIGRPEAKLKFYVGGNHEVMWGDEKRIYGPKYPLSAVKTFIYGVVGKTWGKAKDTSFPKSKVGNQLGSVDFGMEYTGKRYSFFLYRQNIYDVGALSKLANILDGLNGMRIINLNNGNGRSLHIHKVVLELFYTKDQAGGLNKGYIKSGDENYYNNYVYAQGWSYHGAALGNPFITLNTDGRATLSKGDPKDNFINNRVIAFYAGVEGNYRKIGFTGKIAYSKNYGTYGSSPEGHSTGYFRYPPPPELYFHVKNQLSLYGNFSRDIGHDSELELSGALDTGSLLYYNVGVAVTYRKRFHQ